MKGKRPLRKRIKYELLYQLLRFLFWIAGLIPRKTLIKFFGRVGGLAAQFLTKERAIAKANLKLVYGKSKSEQEINKISKNIFKYLGMNWTDAIRYRRMNTVEQFREIIDVEGWEHFHAAFAKGKGVILLANHIGSFDIGGMYLYWEGYDSLVMGAPMHNKKLNKLLIGNREIQGGRFLTRGEDRTNTIKMMKELKANGSVLLLIDQDTNKAKSIFVDFLGFPAATPVGVTIMARKTGAVVLPMRIKMKEDYKHVLTFQPGIEVANTGEEEKDLIEGTQLLSDATGRFVLDAPEQWVWFHERWKRKPADYKDFIF